MSANLVPDVFQKSQEGARRDEKCELEFIKRKIQLFFKQNEACQHLAEFLGIDVLSATALVATVGDANQFQSG